MLYSRHMRLLLASLLLCSCFPEPDFANDAQAAGAAEQNLVLPVFRVPAVDDANPLQAVFIDMSDVNNPVLQLVWKDEDHPVPGIDQAYDADRWWGLFWFDAVPPYFALDLDSDGFHRIADVEDIYYHDMFSSPAANIPGSIEFDYTYSGDQRFNVLIAFHYNATIDWQDFEKTADGRPIIYVNTWNHMMSNLDNNPSMPKTDFDAVPIYKGSRADVENLFQNVWHDFGYDI